MGTSDRRSFADVLESLCAETTATGGKARFSNEQLAASIGVTRAFISLLRKGERDPTVNTVLALAAVFDVHPAYFVGGRRDRAPNSLPSRTFAEKLDTLFRLVHPAGKPEFSPDAIASSIRKRGADLGDESWTMSRNTIADLRNGNIPNPKLRYVLMLAGAFEADPAYFFDEDLARRVDSQLDLHRVMAELKIEVVALRAVEQSVEVRNTILRTLVKALNPGVEVEAAFERTLAAASPVEAPTNEPDNHPGEVAP
ncbi:helix-turn-helix domain-containing protein [Crossiella cryophila]|uniref:Transcriptional regulator with XRE-family HTH domain n=1 Tax=Crossiella cryophila TaxID=43355 RepID=A0A7W7CGR4_9PSEU|nr:helix-turn-helix transcriptional regulator [Crossiella cryophila]MBB4679516.1 transcriptional regulator with XRE-family HTH domain [Crossiella cryophila]